ncbi:extracellular solute-binding protein [Paenibacillus sp. MER TA 81-3]|uniref:extracellular solute-binding protein n=1 Tax=Paenibacillus sp. MER TA 81-3 TaxID=2939573 RepID=UPI00203D7D80|nr:extracellular solute-binding protein [Paenibacillus sp. MER TA 81-3]MCM3339258.1 extracellular solute-binding protein [Paenibacillus sp. MER TA 81-3]
MRRNQIWLSIVAVIAVLSLIGCNGSKSGAGADGGEGDGKQLRQLMPFERFEPNGDAVAQYLKEKTDYTVKYEMLPAENADEKLNLLMANKEPYDVLKLAPAQYYQLVSSGALEPLDDLIEQYGANMKQVIGSESWEGARYEGKTYAIPETGGGSGTASYALVVRQDWLDEMNMKAPTNLDEFVTVLRAFKEKKNVIPLTGGKVPVHPDIASVFGLTTAWLERDGKIIHSVEAPEMREYLAFMSTLYKEGLIDSEWGINTADKSIEKVASGKAAMYSPGWWVAPNLVNALAKNFPDAKLGIVPVLKDKAGVARVGSAGNTINYFIAVPKFANHKEEVVKWLDMKFDKDIFKGIAIGEEGAHHKLEDGVYTPIMPKFADERSNASSFLTGVDEKSYPIYWQARLKKNPVVESYFTTFQKNAEGLLVIDPMSAAPPIPDISKNLQRLNKYQEDTFINFISGTEPLDNYDQFLTEWRAQGGEEMVKAANEWYAKR